MAHATEQPAQIMYLLYVHICNGATKYACRIMSMYIIIGRYIIRDSAKRPTVKYGTPEFRTKLQMCFFLDEKDFTAIIMHFKLQSIHRYIRS